MFRGNLLQRVVFPGQPREGYKLVDCEWVEIPPEPPFATVDGNGKRLRKIVLLETTVKSWWSGKENARISFENRAYIDLSKQCKALGGIFGSTDIRYEEVWYETRTSSTGNPQYRAQGKAYAYCGLATWMGDDVYNSIPWCKELDIGQSNCAVPEHLKWNKSKKS